MAMNPLQALLAAHQPAGPPQGQPSSITVPNHGGPAPSSGGDFTAKVKQLLLQTKSTMDSADDAQDHQVLAKCYVAIQGILATEQKQKEAMLGTTAAHKGLAKASAGSY